MSEQSSIIEYEELRNMRQQNIGRLFLRASRAFASMAVRKLAACGHTGLSMAHASLISHLDLEGTRITTLAGRMGMTKQATGHLVADLEEKGYIASATDPSDRRAILVSFTDTGWQLLYDAYKLKQEIEAEYAHILGEQRFAQLHETLNDLLAHIDDE